MDTGLVFLFSLGSSGARAPWREPIWMTCSTSLGHSVVVVVPICCWWPDSVECDVLFSGLRFIEDSGQCVLSNFQVVLSFWCCMKIVGVFFFFRYLTFLSVFVGELLFGMFVLLFSVARFHRQRPGEVAGHWAGFREVCG